MHHPHEKAAVNGVNHSEMNRSRKAGTFHTPDAEASRPHKARPEPRYRAQQLRFRSKNVSGCEGTAAMQTVENDEAVPHSSHHRDLRHARGGEGGHGNGAAMQGSENDRAVSRPSHSHLENAGGARRFPHSHAHGCCGWGYLVLVQEQGQKHLWWSEQRCKSGFKATGRTSASLNPDTRDLWLSGGSCFARGGNMKYDTPPLEGWCKQAGRVPMGILLRINDLQQVRFL